MISKGRILVVDDSPLVRKLSEIALQEAGYEVHVAENGEEGIKKAESIMPNLILINFIMPKMTGLQFCEKIKETENLSQIPLVLITSKGENVIRSFLEKSLVTDYLQKPYKSEDLVEKVEQVLSKFKVNNYYPSAEEFPKISIEEVQAFEEEQLKTSSEDLLREEPNEIKLEKESLEDITFQEEEKIVEFSVNDITRTKEKEEIQEFEFFQKSEELKEIEKMDLEFQEKSFQEEISLTLEQETEIDNSEKQKDELITDIIEKPIYSEVIEREDHSIIDATSQLQEKKIYGKDYDSLEDLLNRKLRDLTEEITSRVNDSFERVLKKHGLSKNLNVTLSGILKGNMKIENLLRFIIESEIDGVLTFFSSKTYFEVMISNRKIFYCIGESSIEMVGNRLLMELNQEELRDITYRSFSEMMSSSIESFIFEEKVFSKEFSGKLKGFELESILANT